MLIYLIEHIWFNTFWGNFRVACGVSREKILDLDLDFDKTYES